MTDTNKEVLDFTGEGKPKLAGGLNILTILTIIGSILGFVSAVYSFMTAKKSYEDLQKAMDNPDMANAPGWVKNMMSPEMLEVTRKMYENRMPIMVISLVGAALCLYGALEMRKLKKQGYLIWLVGEILPIVALLIFVGTAALSGFGLIGLIFPVIFIILYTVFRKDLVY